MSQARPTKTDQIRLSLHGGYNVYQGVIPRNTVRQFTDIGPLYQKLYDDGICPKVACEVGSWCGASAIKFAAIFEAPIVCVDTWLGSEEHWIDPNNPRHEMHRQHGRPRLYDEFLESTWHYRQYITPLPLPSSIAARVLAHHQFKFDLIYLDGDHSFDGLIADIDSYLPLLADDGILIGDDLNDPRFEVKKAVDAKFERYDTFCDNWWIVRP